MNKVQCAVNGTIYIDVTDSEVNLFNKKQKTNTFESDRYIGVKRTHFSLLK